MSLSAHALTVDDGRDEDDASTPRRPAMDLSPDDTPIASNKTVAASAIEDPASYLRELVLRASISATPKAPIPSSPPTEVESDFDPPRSSSPHPVPVPPPRSVARQTLRNLFTRVRQDTPVKQRRNSAGSVGDNENVAEERVKRASLSDEEIETISSTLKILLMPSWPLLRFAITEYREQLTLDNSVMTSRAAAYYTLRDTLSNSFSAESRDGNARKYYGWFFSLYSYSSFHVDERQPVAGPSGSKYTDTDSSVASGSRTPPAATSTPLRESVSQFPSVYAGSSMCSSSIIE